MPASAGVSDPVSLSTWFLLEAGLALEIAVVVNLTYLGRERTSAEEFPPLGQPAAPSRGTTQVTLTGDQLTDILEAVVPEFEEKRSPAWTEDCAQPFLPSPLWTYLPQHPLTKMRQLKGKPKKETSKDKKERKQAMQEARQQITTVVLPTVAVVVLLIVVFVYVATRPAVSE